MSDTPLAAAAGSGASPAKAARDRPVMIVAGESSGEVYGARLALELKRRDPSLNLLGIGGKRMEEAGVRLVGEMTSAFGIVEVISVIPRVYSVYRRAVEAIKRERPSVVVLIDYPEFNMRLARRARRLGARVLYYVSPQVWAWRRGRVRTLARIVDRMAVLFPFERDFYRESKIECEFVGHPMFEEMRDLDRGVSREELDLGPEDKVLALFPGSRTSEWQRLIPVILEVLKRMRRDYPDFRILVPLAPGIDQNEHAESIEALRSLGAELHDGRADRILSAADAALIVSGTSALQAAFARTPMVIIYRLSPVTFFLFKGLVKTEFICLVNLILNRPVVQELLQKETSTERVLEELEPLLRESPERVRQIDAFDQIIKLYHRKQPSRQVADMVEDLEKEAGARRGTAA